MFCSGILTGKQPASMFSNQVEFFTDSKGLWQATSGPSDYWLALKTGITTRSREWRSHIDTHSQSRQQTGLSSGLGANQSITKSCKIHRLVFLTLSEHTHSLVCLRKKERPLQTKICNPSSRFTLIGTKGQGLKHKPGPHQKYVCVYDVIRCCLLLTVDTQIRHKVKRAAIYW